MNLEWQKRIRFDCLRILNNRDEELEPLRNSKLLVIGGTGFVGSWISEMVSALNDDYHFGINLTLLSRSVDQFSSRLPHIAHRTDVHLINSDVRQLDQIPMEVEWVIHAAANPDVRIHASNPLETASVIVDGTMTVMRAAERLSRLKMLLYLSSGLVSGTQSESRNGITEKLQGAPPPEASFIYPNSKRFAETICSAARVQSRIPVIVTRPFSFIGPYQLLDNPWAQTTFLSDALRGRDIRILGNGQVVRSYLYGSDAAFWFLKILVTGQSGDVVNVGSSVGITLQELAHMVAINFEPTPEIVFNTSPRSIGRSVEFLPDTIHAQTHFGLSVYTHLDDAVKLTVQWHLMQNTQD